MKLFAIAIAWLLSVSVSATILPKNDLHLEDDINSKKTNITEAQFSAIIDEFARFYAPVIRAKRKRLQMRKLWTDSTVNASAQQRGSTWIVNMYGGLARRPEVTPDGFALVVCHELGHHLGGYVFYEGRWAASEGQSDYFATQSCAREVWKRQTAKNAKSRETVHPIAKDKCDAMYSSTPDQDLCYRIAMGGQSLAKLLAALGGTEADFETPDTSKVSRTSTRHPKGQCRLDTYLAGALCQKKFDINVIPGKAGNKGNNTTRAERIANKYTCSRLNGETVGSRPRCWFKPLLSR